MEILVMCEMQLTSGNESSTLTMSSVFDTGVCRAVSSSNIPFKSRRTPTAFPSVNTTLSRPDK